MSQVLNPVVILGQVLHVQLSADPVCQKSPGNKLFLALPKQHPACFGFFKKFLTIQWTCPRVRRVGLLFRKMLSCLKPKCWSWNRSLGRQCLVHPGVAKSSFIEHYLSTFHKWTNTLNGPLSSWPHTASHGAGGWRDPSYQMRKTVGLRGHLMCSDTWRICIWRTWRSRTSFCFAVNVRVQEAKADGRSLC